MFNKVTVIGANGTMGCNVSAIFASFGNAKVYMVCRKIEDAIEAVDRAAKSVRALSIKENLIPKTYDDIEECVKNSDLIFESVFEKFEIKKSVYEMIGRYLNEDKIIASGTSGLSINKLSECLLQGVRRNYMGMHLFNPPYAMTLCEVCPSQYTSDEVVEKVKYYLKNVLSRKVVEVRDEPAFLANRIGFQFINETMQYAEKYMCSGGIDYIDSIIGPFTGRSMAPMVTADFVGLDVHKAIVDNIYENSKDVFIKDFVNPEYIEKLIGENKLGRKTKCGLYKTEFNSNGKKIKKVYDIEGNVFRLKERYSFQYAKHMISNIKVGNYKEAIKYLLKNDSTEAKICKELLAKYIIYSIITTKKIGESIYSADDVMSAGFNWIPPLALKDAFDDVKSFKDNVKDMVSQDVLDKVDLEEVFYDIPKSKYDYRKYFKARG